MPTIRTTDTVDLLVTAAVLAGSQLGTAPDQLRALVVSADRIGQELSDLLAPAHRTPALAYRWQPVGDLFAAYTDEQLVQLERARRFVAEQGRNQAGWLRSSTCDFVNRLRIGLSAELGRAAIDPARFDTPCLWQRPDGLPVVAQPADPTAS